MLTVEADDRGVKNSGWSSAAQPAGRPGAQRNARSRDSESFDGAGSGPARRAGTGRAPGGKASRSPLGRKRRQLLKEVGQIEWFFHQAGGIARRGVRELIGAAAHHDNGQTRPKIGQALKSVPAGFDTQI